MKKVLVGTFAILGVVLVGFITLLGILYNEGGTRKEEYWYW